ncbi:MAG: GNAT family N-acetyltransferase [Thermomicrobiales bacterium]|nr:GNAT family N-acetyltransferase [Thermomicrobiales bacterium]
MTAIRQATLADAHAIATIHVQSWQHAYADILPAEALAALSVPEREAMHQRNLARSDAHYLVAERNGDIIGFATWGITDMEGAMLYSLYMAPTAMGEGVGGRLLATAEDEMSHAGATAAILHVLISNLPTRRFYERHGWQLVPQSDQKEEFFGISVNTVTYHKMLTTPAS